MPEVSFGGSSSGGSWSADPPMYSDGIGLPSGRAMANGSTAVLITALYGYVAGRGGSRSVQLVLGSAATGVFTVGASSDSVPTGWYGTGAWLVNGGTARMHYYFSGGGIYFGKGGGGRTYPGTGGAGWAGTLGGHYRYTQAPTEPQALTLASDAADSVLVSWLSPADNGETAITGYRLQYSLNADFSAATTLELGASNSTTVSGLAAGSTYHFRAYAKNAVTSASGTTSVASLPASIAIASTGTVISGVPAEFFENPGVLWTLAGHNVGFDAQGEIAPLEEAAVGFDWYNNATAQMETLTTVVRSNAAWAEDFTTIGSKVYATSVLGDSLVALVDKSGNYSTQTIAFKAKLVGQIASIGWTGQPNSSSAGTGQEVELVIDPTAGTISFSATRRLGGISSTATASASILGLNLDAELAVLLTYGLTAPSGGPNTYNLHASIREVGSSSFVQVNLSYVADGIDVYTDPWTISGNVRALLTANLFSGSPVSDIREWENAPSYSIDGNIPTAGPILPHNGNVWEYLQMVASGTGCEFTSINGVVTVLPLGARIIDLTNVAGSPTIRPESLFTGRFVKVSYSNAAPVNLGLIYDSAAGDNKTFSVSRNEIKTESVITKAAIQTVLTPSPTGTYPNPLGTYYVIDSEDNPVSPIDWVQYGGMVSVEINSDRSSVLDVTITGPGIDIPGSPGPYTIGNKINSVAVGSLLLLGSGLMVNTQELSLPTGADPEKTPQEFASTIDNVSISTLGQAYDRGLSAASRASIRTTLSATIPLSAAQHLGLVQGAMVRYADNIFRVTDASIGSLDVDITADSYCLVADFDARWNGTTVGDHDARWAGYETQDQSIMPLR